VHGTPLAPPSLAGYTLEFELSLYSHWLASDCILWREWSDHSYLLERLHRVAVGTRDQVCCGFACYSWWLPPSRRLRAAVLCQTTQLKIMRCSGGVCEKLLGSSPLEEAKTTLVESRLREAPCDWTGSRSSAHIGANLYDCMLDRGAMIHGLASMWT
jgi:hypothetical protein